MEILTKYLPFFRLTLFLLALPVFGLAQQFPVNNQKIVQGVGTTAQGISSYSSSPPTTNPSASTWRHVTSLHMDTVLQVQYIYKRPRWYPISVVRRATPPPATASSGSTTIDYTESIWQSTADSLTYYYEEENACWQPIGTYLSSTTPSDVAATGSTGAICYGYGLWYDPDVDSIYAQQGSTWTAIGAGSAGAVDSIAVLQDSIIVGYSEGVEVTRDTIGYPVPDISDIPGLADSLAAAPSGTGTNQRIPVWTGTASLGSSTLLQSATGQTLDANLAFRITGGTTASRPTGAAGMMYWNTSYGWWDYHNGTAWFNPARSATTNGLFTAGSGLFGGSDGTVQQDNTNFFWDDTNNRLGIGVGASLVARLEVLGSGNTSGTTSFRIRNSDFTSVFQVKDNSTFILGPGAGTGVTLEVTSATANLVGFFRGANNTQVYYRAGGASGNAGFFLQNSSAVDIAGFISTSTTNLLSITSAGNIGIIPTGSVGIGTTSPDRLLHSELSDAATNAISFPLRLTHITSGTAAAGSGAGVEFEAESAGGTNRVAGTIENPYTTATNAAEVSDLVFRTMRTGTLTESLRSLGNGTLKIGTLSGTATQLMGATSTNIATAVTLGAGLSFSSGTLNGAFLPLTLTGTTEVNTAGQVLRIRDAGAYPDVYMNSNYWTAASDVNTFIDVGSTSGQMQLNSAGRTIIAAATNVELQAGITGEARIDSDSLVLEGVYPVGTSTDSVLVRDGSTGRVNLRAQSSFGSGTYLPLTLTGATVVNTAANQLTFYDAGDNYPYLAIASTALTFGSAAGTSIASTGADINIESGATGGDINMYSANTLAIETETNISAISNAGSISLSTGDNGDITLDTYSGISGDVNIKAADVVRIQGDSEIVMTGDVKVNSYVAMAYLVGNATAPTITISNAGTGATVTGYSSENSPISGRFTFTTGTGAMAGGNVILVDMPTASTYFPQVPIVQIQGDATKNTAGGLAAAVLVGSGKAVPIATRDNFTLYIDATGLANSTRYDFTYTISSAN